MPDREKVIKGLEYCMGGCQVSCFKCPYRDPGVIPPDCLDNCRILQDAMELLKESASGWISVRDRLPNDAGKYLVTIKSNFADTKYIVKTAWFLNDLYDNWQFRYEGISEHSPGFYNGDGEGDWIENVAYWMPLPEPSEESDVE